MFYIYVNKNIGLGFPIKSPFKEDIMTNTTNTQEQVINPAVEATVLEDTATPTFDAKTLARKFFTGKNALLEDLAKRGDLTCIGISGCAVVFSGLAQSIMGHIKIELFTQVVTRTFTYFGMDDASGISRVFGNVLHAIKAVRTLKVMGKDFQIILNDPEEAKLLAEEFKRYIRLKKEQVTETSSNVLDLVGLGF